MSFVEHVRLADLLDDAGELDRARWLEARRAGIGSSDAPAICNLDSYRSPYHVYVDKLGELPADEDNAAAEWGRRLERVVAERAAEELRCELGTPTAIFRHPQHAWLLASPDFFALDDKGAPIGIIEVKTTSHWREDEWADGPPARVRVQVQHQHMVLGTTKGWIACLVDGRRFSLFECDRDDEDIEAILAIEAEFWRLVETRTPPSVDGSESTRAAIEALYASIGAEELEVELPPDARDWCDEIRTATKLIKQIEGDREVYRNKLREAIGEATVGVLDGKRLATWKTQRRESHYVEATEFRQLRLSRAS